MINIIVSIVGVYLLVGIVFMTLMYFGTEGLGLKDLSIAGYFFLYGACLLWPVLIPGVVKVSRYYKKYGKFSDDTARNIEMLHKELKDENEP